MSRHPVYVTAKLPGPLADAVDALPQTAANRASSFLHTTLLPLRDRTAFDTHAWSLVEEVLVLVARTMAPFRVVFDRLHDNGRTVALRPSEPLRGAMTFQRVPSIAFDRIGRWMMPRHVFRPHITLAWRGGTPGEIAIGPISWLVEDIVLAESVVGETRHIEHGRWKLERAA